MHILIVDDHAMIREALSYGLSVLGHDVAQAEDGAAAIAAIEQRMPDVLITDLEMPRMSGVELIDHARQTYPALPIVATSARARRRPEPQRGARARSPVQIAETVFR